MIKVSRYVIFEIINARRIKMSVKLSKTKIESYVGNVLPLRLISDKNIENEDIRWSVFGDAVSIRSFADDEEHPFSDGILLRFDRVGESTVTASFNGDEYTCGISVREMVKASSEDDLNYYRGDLHTHTTGIHNHNVFVSRTEGFQTDMVDFIKEEGLLDFGVMTDHADVSNNYEYFRCYTTAEKAEPMKTVLFPGCESDNIIMENDIVGREYRAAGEIVIINADYNKTLHGWDDLVDTYKHAPCPIGIFAHPVQARWRFEFAKHAHNPEIVKFMRCVEMGDGTDTSCRLLHEYALSEALDAGFRVTSSCGSDGHSQWGFKIFPGKTVVMARENSKEAITDALRNNRAYASDTGNVKVKLRINGKAAPCDLELADKYSFDVCLSYFEDDDSTKIVKCQVISDYGKVVYEKCGLTENSLSFEVESSTARYFFLRLIDKEGRRTFSPPVWCGREFDKYEEPDYIASESKDFDAYDEISGKNAYALLDFDVERPWENGEKTASIVIDMKAETELAALAYIHPTHPAKDKNDPYAWARFHSKFPRRYRISISHDGKNFVTRAEGGFLTYVGEEYIRLGECHARYLKFEVLSTVGLEYERPAYVNATLHFGGLMFFKKA